MEEEEDVVVAADTVVEEDMTKEVRPNTRCTTLLHLSLLVVFVVWFIVQLVFLLTLSGSCCSLSCAVPPPARVVDSMLLTAFCLQFVVQFVLLRYLTTGS